MSQLQIRYDAEHDSVVLCDPNTGASEQVVLGKGAAHGGKNLDLVPIQMLQITSHRVHVLNA